MAGRLTDQLLVPPPAVSWVSQEMKVGVFELRLCVAERYSRNQYLGCVTAPEELTDATERAPIVALLVPHEREPEHVWAPDVSALVPQEMDPLALTE